jgi:hypothetical protein
VDQEKKTEVDCCEFIVSYFIKIGEFIEKPADSYRVFHKIIELATST